MEEEPTATNYYIISLDSPGSIFIIGLGTEAGPSDCRSSGVKVGTAKDKEMTSDKKQVAYFLGELIIEWLLLLNRGLNRPNPWDHNVKVL